MEAPMTPLLFPTTHSNLVSDDEVVLRLNFFVFPFWDGRHLNLSVCSIIYCSFKKEHVEAESEGATQSPP